MIEVPLGSFTPMALVNLEKLVASKATLIKKALVASDLPILREGERLCFPWFTLGVSEGVAAIYAQFIHMLCEMAKKQQRVVAKEKPADSEKFAFRCLLLRLGYIGGEYAAARKLLLANLSGDGSFKRSRRVGPTGDSDAVTQTVNAADSADTGGVEGACDPNSLVEALADAALTHGVV